MVNRCEVRCASGKGGRQWGDAMCLGEATGRYVVPRGGNGEVRCGEATGEVRCASGRQQVRCSVPRRGNKETRCASGRQRVDAVSVCLWEATGRCDVPRGGNGEVRCGEATG